MQAAAPLPADIRLMNTVATVLWAAFALALVAAGVAWLARQPVFAIRAIHIEGGVERSSPATIRANAAPRLAGNFFTMNLEATRQAFEAVPWVRQATVRRVWPDRLAVRLEEHRAAALWRGERLVNAQGEVFDANLGDIEDEVLPELDGPEGTAASMLAMLRRIGPLLERAQGRVSALSLSGRGSWRVELDTGAQIELGRGGEDEVAARVERFVRTLPQVTDRWQRPLQYADLRHAGGYAVRLQGVGTTPPEPAKPARGRNRTQ
jgi:cell division protein FtsQ